MTSEFVPFKAVMKPAAGICGQRVATACHGGDPRTWWWAPAVRQAEERDLLSLAGMSEAGPGSSTGSGCT